MAKGGQAFTASGRTTWKNGQRSDYSLVIRTGTGANNTLATITGKVKAGLFLNHNVNAQVRFKVQGTPNCTTKPVKTVTFTNTKPFVIV